MYTGSLGAISNREDWIGTSPLIDDDNEEVDLTTASFEMFVCRDGCPETALLTASTDNGKITLPTSTTFQWAFTPDDMGTLCAGTYLVFLRVTIDSVTTQILSCSVPVFEGGPS